MATVQKEGKTAPELDSVSAFDARMREFERKEKGYKGQIAKLQRQLDKQKPNEVSPGSSEVESSAPQAAEKHFAHPWEKKCSTCGGDNENYTGPPNVFCQGPQCKGKIPMGHVDVEEMKKRPKNPDNTVDVPEIKACPNCGSEDFARIEAI